MGVTDELDSEVRGEIERLLASLPAAVGQRAKVDGEGWVWDVAVGSPASEAVLLQSGTWTLTVASLAGDGADLVLMAAGGFVRHAIQGMMLAGRIQAGSVMERVVGLGPVLRAAAERAVTATWILDAPESEARLGRAAVVELTGLESHIRYLAHAGEAGLAEQLSEEKKGILTALEERLGERAVRYRGAGLVRSVAGQQLPSMTARFGLALAGDEQAPAGRAAYGEQSVFAHPTGYREALSSHPLSRVEGSQVVFDARSTVHDEGRLFESALRPLGAALERLGTYLGRDFRSQLDDMLGPLVGQWERWCTTNGCRPPVASESRAALLRNLWP